MQLYFDALTGAWGYFDDVVVFDTEDYDPETWPEPLVEWMEENAAEYEINAQQWDGVTTGRKIG